MITITLTHVYIALVILAALVGWVLAYYEYSKRCTIETDSEQAVEKLTQAYAEDKKRIKDSCDTALASLTNAHKQELEKLELEHESQLKELADLKIAKMKELDDKYNKIIDEQAESIQVYEQYMLNISKLVSVADQTIKTVDARGTFQSDDEIGDFFSMLKDIQKELNKFKVELKEKEDQAEPNDEEDDF